MDRERSAQPADGGTPDAGGSAVVDHLLDRLVELGVDRVFGVPGDFTLGMLDHVVGHPGAQLDRVRERARRGLRGRRVRASAHTLCGRRLPGRGPETVQITPRASIASATCWKPEMLAPNA